MQKKILIAGTLIICLMMLGSCDNSSGGSPPEPIESGNATNKINAKVFFATDFHIIINKPVDVDVFIDDKLVGTLTQPAGKVQRDTIEQYDTEISYPFVVIYEVYEPQRIKYTFKLKSKSSGEYINGQEWSDELYIDKSGNYSAFYIVYEG